MVRSLSINDQRHRALRAILTRVVLSSARVPVTSVETRRDDVFFVRGVDKAEKTWWDDRYNVKFTVLASQ